jgi:hypothetical protein
MAQDARYDPRQRASRSRLTYVLEYNLPLPLLGPLLDSLLMRPGWNRRLGNSLQNRKRHFEERKGSQEDGGR